MSSSFGQNKLDIINREILRLRKQLATEKEKEAKSNSNAARVKASIGRTTSQSLMKSKLQQLNREIDRANRAIKNQAALEKRIAAKEKQKVEIEKSLARSQREAIESLQRSYNDVFRQYERELSYEFAAIEELARRQQIPAKPHDVFISHASEDKEDVVRPLASRLTEMGVDVWYDEMTLNIGDNLRRKIDRGISSARYGIVILSPHFFEKGWPQYELDGLIARELHSGDSIILPIWHKVTKDDVANYSMNLVNRVALNTAFFTIDQIAEKIMKVIKPAEGDFIESQSELSAHTEDNSDIE